MALAHGICRGRRVNDPPPGNKPDLGLWSAEDCVLRSDSQIAGVRDLCAATERTSIDRGDHRLVELESAQYRIDKLLQIAEKLVIPLILWLPRPRSSVASLISNHHPRRNPRHPHP